MKGIVLAGGSGTRLAPLTNLTNKHMLDVYNKHMVMYPLDTLVAAGIEDILIVSGEEHSGHFHKLGSKYKGYSLTYKIQQKKNVMMADETIKLMYGGIADALAIAKDFAGGGKIAVILGDNIFDGDEELIRSSIQNFEKRKKGACVFLKTFSNLREFGVPVFKKSRIVAIEEKPENPKSEFAVVGLYLYDNKVFDFIEKQIPSGRGELEVSDLNNEYIKEGTMEYSVLKGFWSDAGTHESKLLTSMYMAYKDGIDVEEMVKKIKNNKK